MNNHKILSLSLLTSILVLAGCTQTQTTSTTNATVNENILPAQTGNVEVAVNTNTDIDTSDWLTYTNEDFGFSFKYPDEDPYPNEQYNKDNVWNNKTHVTLETYGAGYVNDDDLTVGWGSDIFMRISILPKNSTVTLEDYAISRIDIENKNNQLTAKYIQANAISSTIDEKEMLTFTFNGSGCCLVNHALGAGEISYTFIDLSSSRKMLVTYPLTNESDVRTTEHAAIFQKITESIQFE